MKSAIDEAHQKLRSGDIQNALDTYQFVYKKYSKDSEIVINYVETIESESSHLHFEKYPHICPENQEVKKAADSATLQSRNLVIKDRRI